MDTSNELLYIISCVVILVSLLYSYSRKRVAVTEKTISQFEDSLCDSWISLNSNGDVINVSRSNPFDHDILRTSVMDSIKSVHNQNLEIISNITTFESLSQLFQNGITKLITLYTDKDRLHTKIFSAYFLRINTPLVYLILRDVTETFRLRTQLRTAEDECSVLTTEKTDILKTVESIRDEVDSLLYWAELNSVAKSISNPYDIPPIKAVSAKLQKVSLELSDVNLYYKEREGLMQEFGFEDVFQTCVGKFVNQGLSLGLTTFGISKNIPDKMIGDPEATTHLLLNILQLNLRSSQTIPIKVIGHKIDHENAEIKIETSLGIKDSIEFKVIKKIVTKQGGEITNQGIDSISIPTRIPSSAKFPVLDETIRKQRVLIVCYNESLSTTLKEELQSLGCFVEVVPTFFVATLYINSKQFSLVLVHSTVNDVSISAIDSTPNKRPPEGPVFVQSLQKPSYVGVGFSSYYWHNVIGPTFYNAMAKSIDATYCPTAQLNILLFATNTLAQRVLLLSLKRAGHKITQSTNVQDIGNFAWDVVVIIEALLTPTLRNQLTNALRAPIGCPIIATINEGSSFLCEVVDTNTICFHSHAFNRLSELNLAQIVWSKYRLIKKKVYACGTLKDLCLAYVLANLRLKYRLRDLPSDLIDLVIEKLYNENIAVDKGFTSQPCEPLMSKLIDMQKSRQTYVQQPVWHVLNSFHLFSE